MVKKLLLRAIVVLLWSPVTWARLGESGTSSTAVPSDPGKLGDAPDTDSSSSFSQGGNPTGINPGRPNFLDEGAHGTPTPAESNQLDGLATGYRISDDPDDEELPGPAHPAVGGRRDSSTTTTTTTSNNFPRLPPSLINEIHNNVNDKELARVDQISRGGVGELSIFQKRRKALGKLYQEVNCILPDPEPLDFCQWPGVVCNFDETNTVVSLDIACPASTPFGLVGFEPEPFDGPHTEGFRSALARLFPDGVALSLAFGTQLSFDRPMFLHETAAFGDPGDPPLQMVTDFDFPPTEAGKFADFFQTGWREIVFRRNHDETAKQYGFVATVPAHKALWPSKRHPFLVVRPHEKLPDKRMAESKLGMGIYLAVDPDFTRGSLSKGAITHIMVHLKVWNSRQEE